MDVGANPRDRQLRVAAETEYDLVIVGGGIFGACALWEASLRGLKAVLFEAHDFCSGSSANSYKIVHGGTRYIQHLDIPRVRASAHERRAMLRIAPHLVEPLPILVPTYGLGKMAKWFLAAGLSLYDLVTLDRNRGITDPDRRLKSTRLLSRQRVLETFPGVAAEGLTGACVFEDGRFYNPTRLVYTFIKSALTRGAAAINYCPATALLLDGDQVTGVRVRDSQSGQQYNVRAKAVLNAAGPWTERLLRTTLPQNVVPDGPYSRDACFVIKRRFSTPYTLALQGQTSDPDALLSRPARHLFLSPWRDYTLVGVWHKVTTEHPEAIQVSAEELQCFIDEMNASMPSLALTLDDVLFWNAGLVPFGENDEGSTNLSYGKRSLLMDHQELNGIEGLVSLIGVRYTMARGEAQKALDMLQRKIGQRLRPSISDRTRLQGADFGTFQQLKKDIAAAWPIALDLSALDAMAHNCGSDYRSLLPLLAREPQLAEPLPACHVTGAEVLYRCRTEMVQTLGDLVFRRTDIATAGHPGQPALQAVARIAQAELGWPDAYTRAEIVAVERRFPQFNEVDPMEAVE